MAKFVELALTALQFHAEGLLTIGDILFSSRERTRRWFYRIPTEEQRWFKENWADVYRNRQQFYRTISYLQRQGLVERKSRTRKSGWVLTERGKERRLQYREVRQDPFSSASAAFPKPHGSGITIITYDIPERERRKRDWMRRCLMEMDCERIQQSVWVAKGAIDADFMHALRERDLLRHVHIFAVTKQGTIHTKTA